MIGYEPDESRWENEGGHVMSSRLEEEITVTLTGAKWRAIAAVLLVAANIADEPLKATLFKSLYDELASQANVRVKPVVVDE
jgi:hypothetical protein